MTKWNKEKIGDVCSFITDGSHNPPKGISQSEYLMLSSKDVQNGKLNFTNPRFLSKNDFEIENRRTNLQVDDVLLTTVGTIGRTAIYKGIPANVTFQRSVSILRPILEKISPQYLMYYLDSITHILTSESRGVAQQGIYLNQLKKIEISYPPLHEQQKIVEILEVHLSRLDAALADVKQAKLKAAQFRRSLLRAAFTGKLTGDGTRLMTGARSNWKEISLGELGKWITGSTPKSSNPLNFGNDVDFVTPSDIGYGGLLGPTERKISHLGASAVRKVKAPSVNLVCIGTIGKVALARRDVTTNQQINSLEVDKSVVDPNFVMWLLSSPEIQEKLWESASSTTVPILNKGNLEKIKTHIPPLPEQQKIVEILEDHLSRLDVSVAIADAMEKQSASLRRSLLQAAFTGQLTKEVASV